MEISVLADSNPPTLLRPVSGQRSMPCPSLDYNSPQAFDDDADVAWHERADIMLSSTTLPPFARLSWERRTAFASNMGAGVADERRVLTSRRDDRLGAGLHKTIFQCKLRPAFANSQAGNPILETRDCE